MSDRPGTMPIELILAAHDFRIECILSIVADCPNMAARIVTVKHENATAERCGSDEKLFKLPLCADHTKVMVWSSKPSALAEMLGVPPMSPCSGCGGDVEISRITDMHGNEVDA